MDVSSGSIYRHLTWKDCVYSKEKYYEHVWVNTEQLYNYEKKISNYNIPKEAEVPRIDSFIIKLIKN